MSGAPGVGRSVRARDLALGMLLACTSLVGNAVVSGGGSLAPRMATALPEPFTLQGASAGSQRDDASVVARATALVSSTFPLTGSGRVVPGTGTGQWDDGSLGYWTDGTATPAGADPVEAMVDPVLLPPDAPPAFEPGGVPGDEPEGPPASVLQPITELLAPVVQPVAPLEVVPAIGVTEATEPALSMLSPPLVL